MSDLQYLLNAFGFGLVTERILHFSEYGHKFVYRGHLEITQNFPEVFP